MDYKIIRVQDRDFDDMIFYMFLYSLGRMTYAVSDTVRLLTRYWESIPYTVKDKIKSEIEDAIKLNNAGMDMDVEEWNKILEL